SPPGAPTTPPVALTSTGATAPGADLLATPGLAVEMPDDLVWRDVQGVALPYSASKGPSNTLGGLATGFAHDAAGAVLAAAHIIVRINPQVGPNVFEPTLREQVVGPDVPALRDTIVQAYAALRQQAGVPYGDPAGQIPATLLGFRVDSYTDTDAEVRLITEGTDGRGGTATTALRLYVQWSGDDWVLAFPAGADLSTANVAVDATSLYTPFGER
ncbi:MAG: hypothetical protein IRY85_22940, partial [Micromonosporaceae bacterium]|nr:hypothetical protein [Micromonosporaceae bacterium]